MGHCLLVLTLVASGCSAELMDPPGVPTDAAPGTSDAVDAPGDAFMLGPWGTPTPVMGASTTTANEDDATLSSSGLEMVFAVVNAADANRKDLYVATRTSTAAGFGTPTKLALSLTGSSEETPRLSSNDMTLYFASDRAGGAGGLDVYKTTRTSANSPWGAISAVTGPNTVAADKWFMPCGMGNDYMMILNGDLAAGTLGGAAPTVVAELSSTSSETGTFLTSDCLTIYFASARSGTNALYTSHRTSLTTPWQSPSQVIDFAVLGGAQEDPWISADGRTFVFVSNVTTTKDVYISVR